MSLPIVAIVGRPNVGKSTLFNRLLGRPEAIVSPIAGTTRDRVVGQAVWQEFPFILVDTGGLEPGTEDPLRAMVRVQAEIAVEEADVVWFVVDSTDGVTPSDLEIVSWLRRIKKPVLLVANKSDNVTREAMSAEFYRIGLGDPIAISAFHNTGIFDLMTATRAKLPEPEADEEKKPEVVSVAIVGRPNVGKSSLLNSILGEPRAIVSDIPGTTRDVLDTPFEFEGTKMVLIDTAGIRRRGRVEEGIERYSVLRSVRAVERADVVAMVVDTKEGPTAQDAHIMGLAFEMFKGLVLVVNKWDLQQEMQLKQQEVENSLRAHFHFAQYAPMLFTSATKNKGTLALMRAVIAVHQERSKWVSQRVLERVVLEALGAHPPPSQGGRRLKIERVLQGGINPPTFVFYVNHPDLIHFSYQRYLENRLRETFHYRFTHLRMVFKKPEVRRRESA